MTELNWVFQGGKLVQAVTSITLANNTAKENLVTVPSGKRWLLLNIKITNPDDVSRVVNIIKWKEAAKTNTVKTYMTRTLAAGETCNVPSNQNVSDATKGTNLGLVENPPFPEVLDEGNTISLGWATGGASTGGTDADGQVVEYLEIDI